MYSVSKPTFCLVSRFVLGASLREPFNASLDTLGVHGYNNFEHLHLFVCHNGVKNHFFKMIGIYREDEKTKKQGVITQLSHTKLHDTIPVLLKIRTIIQRCKDGVM